MASSSLAMSAMTVYPPGMRLALMAAATAGVIAAAVLSLAVIGILGTAGCGRPGDSTGAYAVMKGPRHLR